MRLSYQKSINVEIVQFPCIQCDFDGQLEVWQDRRYDTATVTCPKCNVNHRGSISWNCDRAEVIQKIWNPPNDVNAAIERLEKQLANIPNTVRSIKEQIKQLKKKQK